MSSPAFDVMLQSHPQHQATTTARYFEKAFWPSLNRLRGEGGEHRKYADFIAKAITGPEDSAEMADLKRLGAMTEGPWNVIAKELRDNISRGIYQNPAGAVTLPKFRDVVMAKSGVIAKSILDVGSQLNLSSVTGGQSVGLVSLDTQLARGTIRPGSFTLYQMLRKTQAFQIVDFWAYIDDPGGAAPGSAFTTFGGAASGPINFSVGDYTEQYVKLAMLYDGRALSIALAAQASFVDLVTQESANAALVILSSVNWACYWGNSTNFPVQFNGLSVLIPAANVFDFQQYFNTIGATRGETPSQAIYNLIYQASADITSWYTFGRVTHALMAPIVLANMASLVTAAINNIITPIGASSRIEPELTINGDLRGMKTAFGVIQFALDLTITAREVPQQGQPNQQGVTRATTVAPSPPTSVTVAAITGSGAAGSAWTAAYAGSVGGVYYAVCSTDASMNESTLAYSTLATTVVPGGAYTVTIAAPGANDAYAYRVFRSGVGGNKSGVAATPASYRGVGTILANGSSNVVFTDLNTVIPGSQTIFLLDLADEDNALDFRFLLPLTRVELFAQAALQMPWAVTMIGSLRVRIPKFHGKIKNFVADDPLWNPLAPN